jgi:hypothetical protein
MRSRLSTEVRSASRGFRTRPEPSQRSESFCSGSCLTSRFNTLRNTCCDFRLVSCSCHWRVHCSADQGRWCTPLVCLFACPLASLTSVGQLLSRDDWTCLMNTMLSAIIIFCLCVTATGDVRRSKRKVERAEKQTKEMSRWRSHSRRRHQALPTPEIGLIRSANRRREERDDRIIASCPLHVASPPNPILIPKHRFHPIEF